MLRKTLLTISVGAAVLVFGAGSSKADVIFGAVPAAPACTTNVGTAGVVGCASNPESFTGTNAEVIQASGFSNFAAGSPGAPDRLLTVKLIPAFTEDESGLGVQAAGGGCITAECEINPPNAATAVDTTPGSRITDARIGSVQAGEMFNFFVENNLGDPFTLLTTTGNACSGPGFTAVAADECMWTAPPGGRAAIALQSINAGDVTLVEVSTSAPVSAPEPASLALLLSASLIGFGVMRRRWR
jgi:hypothetical protein